MRLLQISYVICDKYANCFSTLNDFESLVSLFTIMIHTYIAAVKCYCGIFEVTPDIICDKNANCFSTLNDLESLVSLFTIMIHTYIAAVKCYCWIFEVTPDIICHM